MADEQTPLPPQVRINTQYVKDLSFENPNAPRVIAQPPQDTRLQINVDLDVIRLDETVFEVVLKLDIQAKSGETSVFVIDLAYAGVFTLQNIPAEQVEPVCLIECPRLIFPFARRVVADLTRDGGFMPLLLDPIDFMRLYQQHRQRQAEAQQEAGASA